jgi:hypothetical protein
MPAFITTSPMPIKIMGDWEFLACLTFGELEVAWFNGSTAARALRMPVDPSWYQSATGRTMEQGKARHDNYIKRMDYDIRDMRIARGVCPICADRMCTGGHK